MELIIPLYEILDLYRESLRAKFGKDINHMKLVEFNQTAQRYEDTKEFPLTNQFIKFN